MTTRNIDAPSGLKGTVRSLKGKEGNVLADRVQARKLMTFDRILDACWTHTEDAGPLGEVYLNGSGNPDWGKVLLADRWYVLVQIRIATYGTEYSFKHKCHSCDESFEWSLDLVKDLKLDKFTPETLEQYLDGNRFASEFPNGTKFWFQLNNGENERVAAKRLKKKRDEAVTVSLSERIIEIDGCEKGKKAIRAYLEEMELDDQYEIIDIMDETDAGYVTDIEVECADCGNEDLVRLPFVEGFWISQRRRRKRAAAED